MQTAKVYLVGGAVRDKLLGLDPKDKDYVVVGSTPEKMLADGFTQVGASFPVFLHPVTGEEYALARTERKTGSGYHGFETFYDPTVTLEDDLERRDLTINSMAMDADGKVIDPFGGQQDLLAGLLRHTSDAFADDPLRVLRLARFASRYNFKVALDTTVLASKLVASGELDTLPRERIWTELSKGLSEKNVDRMLYTLKEVGAFERTPLVDYFGVDFNVGLARFMMSLISDAGSDVNSLLCMPPLSKLSNDALTAMKVPNHLRDAARLDLKMTLLLTKAEMTAEDVHEFLTATRFDETSPTTSLAMTVSKVRATAALKPSLWSKNLDVVRNAVDAVKSLDLASVVAAGDMKTVKYRVDNAKFNAVKSVLS